MDRNLEPWNYKTNLDNQGSLSCPEWKFWINFFITKKLEKLLVVFQFYLSNRGSINCALKQRGPMRFHLVSFKKFNEENFKVEKFSKNKAVINFQISSSVCSPHRKEIL